MDRQPDEWERLERKAKFGRDVVRTVAAFCNTEGGVIEVGVHDDGRPTGELSLGGRTLEDWANTIKRDTDPGQTPRMLEEERQGCGIVTIHVTASPIKPVLAYGTAYKRVGRTNQTMGYGEIQRLIEESTGGSWDDRLCPHASFEDISDDEVIKFVAQAKNERGRDMPGTAEEVLAKLELARDTVPTFAAVLLFGEDPQAHLPQSAVKCARFAGTQSHDFLDECTLYGNLFQQLKEAHEFALRHISKAIELQGELQRRETWQYPPEAVRELLVNAICHRDYQDTGNVQLRIYDDRIEVWTPGGLPDPVTPEMLTREHRSVPRNPRIADAFFLTGHIEQWGTGTLRVIAACRASGLPDPEFEDGGRTFVARIQLAGAPSDADLIALGMNARQLAAVRHVEKHGRITAATYRESYKVDIRTAISELLEIVHAGIFTREGEGHAARYRLSVE